MSALAYIMLFDLTIPLGQLCRISQCPAADHPCQRCSACRKFSLSWTDLCQIIRAQSSTELMNIQSHGKKVGQTFDLFWSQTDNADVAEDSGAGCDQAAATESRLFEQSPIILSCSGGDT